MPTPNRGESDSVFLDRCMGEDRMKQEFPDNSQRYAVCQSKLRESHGSTKSNEGEKKQ